MQCYRPEILIHEWKRPRHLTATVMPRPRLPYHVSIGGVPLADSNGAVRYFSNYTLACNAGREAVRSRGNPARLIAEARIALNNLELMLGGSWVGDKDYPGQEAKRLHMIAAHLVDIAG